MAGAGARGRWCVITISPTGTAQRRLRRGPALKSRLGHGVRPEGRALPGPSSRFYDRDYKLEAYLGVGVEEMWLVDLDRRCVAVSALDGRRLITHLEHVGWRPAAMPEPCELDLAELFRDVP